MKAKKQFLSLLLCGTMLFSLCPQAVFAEDATAGGLCEHHTQHSLECGYTEGSEETPCGHEHTEDCYILVTECVHKHGPECYPAESTETAETESISGDTSVPSEPKEQEPAECTHVCSEESGCITKEPDCKHKHDEACGYAPAVEGTPCTYVCEICNSQNSGEAEETEPEAACICTGFCTEEMVNAECPICGAEGADLTACKGVEAEIAALPNALAAKSKADTGVFTVTGGTLGIDYAYEAPSEYDSNGGDTLTIKSGTPLTISTNSESETTGGCRIVIENNVTANITLAGVNITPTDANNKDGYSGIDLGSGATLNITLQSGNSNVIKGGTSTTGSPGPGIHVPEGSTLTIKGEGSLTVEGASGDYAAAVGIGGNGSASEAGEACGNVIILEGAITVNGGNSTIGSVPVDIGGGVGAAVGGGKGSDGTGIKPTGDGTYTVYGDLILPCDITIPQGATVVIPDRASLTVPGDVELTNNGTILMQGGEYTNNGTLTGNQPAYPSRVTVSFSQNGQTVNSVPYGSTVTISATMEKAERAVHARSADTGKVIFYLGDANDTTEMRMGTGDVKFEDGAYTASLDVTLDQDKGFDNPGTFKFTADFGGYAPEGNESGDSLAPNTGSAQLTVVESYTIDYGEETITIADGFSLYAAESGGNAIFTSTAGSDTTSLTNYIQNNE